MRLTTILAVLLLGCDPVPSGEVVIACGAIACGDFPDHIATCGSDFRFEVIEPGGPAAQTWGVCPVLVCPDAGRCEVRCPDGEWPVCRLLVGTTGVRGPDAPPFRYDRE